MSESLLERLSTLDPAERDSFLADEAEKRNLTPAALKGLMLRSWSFVGRPKQQVPDGDWTFTLILAGRGFGKLLNDETRLATPSGWTTMRDVAVGDELLDESGRPTRVTWKSDRQVVEAYRVRFSDGSEILACADHQWVTWDHPARKAYGRSRFETPSALPDDWPKWRPLRSWHDRPPKRADGGPGPRIRTTAEIKATIKQGLRGDRNHSIPVTAPLELPDRDLPIDPYILGYWLGDGTTLSGQITIHPDDQPSFFKHAEAYLPRRCSGPNMVGTRGLLRDLRQLGVLGAKHVPAIYLRASRAQRLALLQGLMDSDGHALARTPHVEFCSTLPCLADAVAELARSLGEKPVVASAPSMLNGREYKTKYRVTWRPTIVPFRLPRKADRVSPLRAQGFRSRHRMITAVEPTGVHISMHCVTVDSPHSIYLAGDAMIPTHNTASGSQWVKRKALESRCRIAVVAPTLRDVRSTLFEGETGILSVMPNDAYLGQSRSIAWNKSLFELTLANGSVVTGFSSEEPARLRGPQHHYAWGDEVSSWADARHGDVLDSTFSNLKLGLRSGDQPQALFTTTPKANRLTVELVGLAESGILRLVKGSSYENRANLPEAWWQAVVAPLEGTRTGRQEIEAELLEDVEGALWTRWLLDECRVEEAPALRRVVVAVDPNTTSGESADDAGIVVAGQGHADGHAYVLEDRTQTKGGPRAWARAAVDCFHDHQADVIVAETNNGGEMVKLTIHAVDASVPVKLVTASRGKRTRAEPVAALYGALEPEKREENPARVHHVGVFPALEDELTTWTPAETDSPGRMDALVWAVTELKIWADPPRPMRVHVPRGRLPTAADRFGTGYG